MNSRSKLGNFFHLLDKPLRTSVHDLKSCHVFNRMIPVISFLLIFSETVLAQNWEGIRKTGFLDRWAITANYGYTSYYGDLSLYDHEIKGKITRESGPAYGAIISKYLNNIFGVSGQVLIGNLKGSKDNLSFNTELLEYNLQFRINFINLFNNYREHKIGLLGFAGIGQFLFTTTTQKNVEGKISTQTYSSGVPEFVLFAGGGAHYIIGSNLSISAGLSLRQCQNDKLDGLKNNGNYDYYTYLNLGLTYYVPSFAKRPLRNKARIACSNFKFASNHHR